METRTVSNHNYIPYRGKVTKVVDGRKVIYVYKDGALTEIPVLDNTTKRNCKHQHHPLRDGIMGWRVGCCLCGAMRR